MKILLVSDSHKDINSLKEVIKRHPDVDIYLHAGDSELPEEMIYPFLSCKGNCDYFSKFKNQIIFKTSMGNMMLRHSPYLNEDEKENHQIKIYLYGHTHVRHFELIDGVYFINPGSLTRPRDGQYGSYAIIEIENNDIKVSFMNL